MEYVGGEGAESLGLLKGKEVNKMRLVCVLDLDINEPMLTPNGMLIANSMVKKKAADAVRNGELRIVPDFHEATW
jgi:valyl-tRNA synthetase